MRVHSGTDKIFTGLDLLVGFLNEDFGGAKKTKNPAIRLLLRCCRIRSKSLTVKRLQTEIYWDIACIVQTEAHRIVYPSLRALVQKINGILLKSEWVVVEGEKEFRVEVSPGKFEKFVTPESKNPFFPGPPPLGPTQRILKIGSKKWIVYRRPYDESSIRKWLYGIVIAALESGEIARLRRCSQCRRFFIAHDARKKFCSTYCKDKFNNKRRQSEGYFSKHRKLWRSRDIEKARKLIREGKSAYEVKKETGLPSRVLVEEGLS